MPAIPIYQRQTRPSGAAMLGGADAGAFGAQIGGAVRELGRSIEDVEDHNARVDAAIEAKRQQRADEDAQADAAVRFARMASTVEKSRAQYRLEAPAGAPGHGENVLKNLDEIAGGFSEGITNRKAAQWWQTHLAEFRGKIDVDEAAFEAGARANKLAVDVGATIDLESNNLFTTPDAKQFPVTMKRVLGTIDALALPAEKKEELANAARDQMGLSFVRGLAQKDPYAARALIQSGQLNDIVGKDKLPSLNERIDGEIRSVEAEQRRQQAEARREAREARQEVGDRIEDNIAYLESGGQMDAATVQDTIETARRIGRPELARRAERLGVASVVTTQFRGAAPAELQDHIHELDKRINAAGDKASPALLAEREASVKLLGNMQTELGKDPLSWASRAGSAKLDPIDWNNPATMRARVAPATATARRYGTPVQFFTDEEKAALTATLATAKPEQKLAIARTITRGFGASSGEALKTLGLNGTFTHAAGLSSYGGQYSDVARRIFVGQETAKTSALVPQGDKVNALARAELGRALAYQPQTMTNAVAAANALYVERATRRGIKSREEFDEDLWKQGLNEALGGLGGSGGLYTPGTAGVRGYVRSNKPQVVLPVGMAPARFDDLIYNISAAEVKAAGGGKAPTDSQGRPLALSTFRGASLFSKGDGKYLVSLDANGTQFLRGAGPNGYYVLDVKALDRMRAAAAR